MREILIITHCINMIIIWIIAISFILFVVLNFLALIVLQLFQKANTPFLIDGENTLVNLRKIFPGDSDDDIKDRLWCFSGKEISSGKRFSMIYAPFTEHRDSFFESKHLNVSKQGIRFNEIRDDNKLQNTTRRNIYLFGGSTTFGYGVSDKDTIAAQLQLKLRKDNQEIQVFNFGRQSYYSSIEFIAFQRLLQSGFRPHTVIFIDGLNDVFHNFPVMRNKSRYSETIEKNWILFSEVFKNDNTYWKNSLSLLIKTMPIYTLGQKFIQRIEQELFKSDSMNNRCYENWSRGVNIDKLDTDNLADQISQLTKSNWDMLRAVCAQFNIKVYFVLQPVYYLKTDLSKHLFKLPNEHPKWYEIYNKYYLKMQSINKDKRDFIDMSSLFIDVESCPFVDSHHYSPCGNKLIADCLAEKVFL